MKRPHLSRTSRHSLAAATAVLVAVTGLGFVAAPAGAGTDTETAFTNTWNNPNANYLNQASCLVNLSSYVDFTVLASVTQCGHTVTFTGSVEKRSIPASWPGWGQPNQTEIPNPDLLYTMGNITLVLTFSTPRRVAGFEITPQMGVVQNFKADYIDASGSLIGQINKTITGGRARLIAAKTQAATKVKTIQISSNGDFAIGRLRFRP